MPMRWTEYHERKALELFKYIKSQWENDKKFTCSMTSLIRKLENNLWLDTNGKQGLSRVSKLNKEIFERFQHSPTVSRNDPEENIKEKIEIKKRLLKEYEKIYKNNPEEWTGACRISRRINLSEEQHGYNYWKTHNQLLQLEKAGYLEQKKRSGFRFKCCHL